MQRFESQALRKSFVKIGVEKIKHINIIMCGDDILMKKKEKFGVNRGASLFVIESTAEYLISILVSGSYLATLTSALGMGDALTGVISAFVSLGCLFQLLSLFYHKKNPKKFLLLFSLINQILFMALYIIPDIKIGSNVKTAIFTLAILSAYVLYYFAHPKKITWYTSFR